MVVLFRYQPTTIMKTISSIKLENEKEDFSVTRFVLKVSILFVVTFLLLNVFGIPVL